MPPIRRGDMWRIPTVGRTRDVVVISVDGVPEQYGTVVAVPTYPLDEFRESLVTVRIDKPIPCLALTIDVANFRVARFTDGEWLGRLDEATLEQLDAALRAVLGL
jgi:mRNA-degrading endonuclease toxin of MazEF toxin-antitoxin module